MPNRFSYKFQFYLKEFSLAWVHGLIIKNVSISSYSVLIQTIQFSMSKFFVHTLLNVKTVLFQIIQFSMSTQFSSIWPIDSATTPGQSGPGSDCSEGMLLIPQSSSITGTYSSEYFMLYPGHSLGRSYTSADVKSVYFTAPADWATDNKVTYMLNYVSFVSGYSAKIS